MKKCFFVLISMLISWFAYADNKNEYIKFHYLTGSKITVNKKELIKPIFLHHYDSSEKFYNYYNEFSFLDNTSYFIFNQKFLNVKIDVNKKDLTHILERTFEITHAIDFLDANSKTIYNHLGLIYDDELTDLSNTIFGGSKSKKWKLHTKSNSDFGNFFFASLKNYNQRVYREMETMIKDSESFMKMKDTDYIDYAAIEVIEDERNAAYLNIPDNFEVFYVIQGRIFSYFEVEALFSAKQRAIADNDLLSNEFIKTNSHKLEELMASKGIPRIYSNSKNELKYFIYLKDTDSLVKTLETITKSYYFKKEPISGSEIPSKIISPFKEITFTNTIVKWDENAIGQHKDFERVVPLILVYNENWQFDNASKLAEELLTLTEGFWMNQLSNLLKVLNQNNNHIYA